MLKPGDVVRIVKIDGFLYYQYKEMAEKLNATNWKKGELLADGTICIIKAKGKHLEDDTITICLIENDKGEQVLINEVALKLLKSSEFEVGSIIKIISCGEVYSSYISMAEKFKATNWKKGRFFANGTICKIIKKDKHPDDNTIILYLLENEKGEQAIYRKNGIELYKPPESTPDQIPINQRYKFKKGDKIVCVSNDYPYKCGDILTFDSAHEDVRFDLFKPEEKHKSGIIISLAFHRWELLKEKTESMTLSLQQEKTKPKKEVKSKTKKETEKMATPTLSERVKKAGKSVTSKQVSMAKKAAMLEGARILNNQLVKLAKPKLPMMARGYVETPIGKAVLANIMLFAIESVFPNAPEDDIKKQIAEAAVVQAYQEVISTLNISEMIEQLFDSSSMKKITKQLEEDEEL